MLNKQSRRRNIRYRIRKKVKGTSSCPRLSVFRSNKQIYAQLGQLRVHLVQQQTNTAWNTDKTT